MRVLIAEDNLLNQRILERMLAGAASAVGRARTGREALEGWEEGRWDLILMDCQMPEMDGLTAAREIREREARLGRAPIPIIAVTANAAASDQQECLAAGMSDFLTKPVQREALVEAIRRWAPTPEPLP